MVLVGLVCRCLTSEADSILTDTVSIDDRDRVMVLAIGLLIRLVVGLGLVMLLHSSFIGTKSV